MTADDRTPIADDPDLDHLLDLLSMLPGPKENPDFWGAVQAEGLPNAAPDTRDAVSYVFEKMSGITRLIDKPTPLRIENLSKYLLFFFSAGKPEIHKVLNAITPTESSWGQDDTGRWWAEDITRTAWTLYVRYHQYGDDRWKEKWHFDQTWLDWLPDRGR